jgi:copper chaperone CopZ
MRLASRIVAALTVAVLVPLAASTHATEEPATQTAEAVETSLVFVVSGMSCGGCKAAIEEAVGTIDGVQSAELAFGERTLTVAVLGDAAEVHAAVVAAVTDLGYGIEPAP